MTNNAPVLVSVVIPTFNSSAFLIEALDSAVKQTYKNLEIIIIDDGSTDETAVVVQNFDYPIRYFFQKNQGSAVARNRGVELSNGKYIAFLDADDLWVSNKLQLQVDTLENSNTGLVCFGIDKRVVDNFKLDDSIVISENNVINKSLSGQTLDKAIVDCPYHINNLMVNRSFLLERNIRFNVRLRKGQDSSFIYQICANTSVIYLNTVLSFYRDNKNSITYSMSKINYRKLVLREVFQNYSDLLQAEYNISDAVREKMFVDATYQHAYSLYYHQRFKYVRKLLRPLISKKPGNLALYKLFLKAILTQLYLSVFSKRLS